MNVFKYSDVIDGFCWYITKLSLRKLIVVYILLIMSFCYQFLKSMWFWTLKIALAEWDVNSNYMAQLIFYHLQKLIIVYSMFSSLGSHLDFPEYFLMVVSHKFIRNLEAAIKARERYSSNLGKNFAGGGIGDHFHVKLR